MVKSMREKYHYSLILLRELVITDFKLRYQGSVLGFAWSLLKPMFLFLILYLVFVQFLKVGGDMPHWPIGLLIGIVLWNFFVEVTSGGIGSVVGRGDVIRKINFPKYIIVLASSASALINLGLNLIVISIFMVINGVELSWLMILAPIYMLEIFFFGLGIAFLLSAVYVRFRDVNFIWEIVLQGMFYASIVLFPVSDLLKHAGVNVIKILLMNPVAQAIQDVRYVLLSQKYPTLGTLVDNGPLVFIPFALTVALFIFGAWYFRKKSPSFAEDI